MEDKTPLCKLALKYGTDKVKDIRHDYTPFYHTLLKDRQIKRVLEVGVFRGNSLRMWAEYFPEAEVWGLDNYQPFLFNEGRIHCMYCDQGDAASLRGVKEMLGGTFDLIVDDGSHLPQHQVLTAQELLPLLAPSGVYIIEDVDHPELVTPYLIRCEVHTFNLNQIYDDRLVVIRRPS